MKKVIFSIAFFPILWLLSSVALSQISYDKTERDVLPSLSKPVGCGLALRYIDDALEKATSKQSTIIFIVRSRNPHDTALARVRSKNLRNYVRFRGSKNYEVAVDLATYDIERIDIFVQGELLYSLRIGKADRLKFTNC
ncbi:MAG: hypothetical protein C4287_23115 [Leptolyngbya sp. ERB_1_2]